MARARIWLAQANKSVSSDTESSPIRSTFRLGFRLSFGKGGGYSNPPNLPKVVRKLVGVLTSEPPGHRALWSNPSRAMFNAVLVENVQEPASFQDRGG